MTRVYAKGALSQPPPSPPLQPEELPPDVGLPDRIRQMAGRGWRKMVRDGSFIPNNLRAGPVSKYKQRRIAAWYATKNLRGTIQTAMFDQWYRSHTALAEACSSCDERRAPLARAARVAAALAVARQRRRLREDKAMNSREALFARASLHSRERVAVRWGTHERI